MSRRDAGRMFLNDPTICYLQEIYFNCNDRGKLKVQGWERDTMHAIHTQRKAECLG